MEEEEEEGEEEGEFDRDFRICRIWGSDRSDGSDRSEFRGSAMGGAERLGGCVAAGDVGCE